MRLDPEQIKEMAYAVIETEAAAVSHLRAQIDEHFLAACKLLGQCQGRIVLLGMGKSGHIAKKISSTFASTGSAAFYIHPAEAGHGDLGMIRRDDVVIILSYSGETEEINQLLPSLKQLTTPIIALTGTPHSTLAQHSNVVIDTSVEKEACQLGLAPTASTTAALAMGDALAIILQNEKGFTPEDFAKSHPGGHLGKQLTTKISDVMRTGDAIPKVTSGTSLTDALCEMSSKGLGMTLIMDEKEQVIGIFTDGDLRRTFEQTDDIKTAVIDDVMTREYHSVSTNELAYSVLHRMRFHLINSSPVFDADDELVGALNMHDILRAGL